MKNTVTKKQKYELIKSALNGNVLSDTDKDMLIDFIENEVSLLERKASATSNKTNEKRNAVIELIRDVLNDLPLNSDGLTVTQMLKDDRVASADISAQKLNAALTYMRNHTGDEKVEDDTGDIVRTVIKGTPYFRLA